MANTATARKRVRQAKNRTLQNNVVKSQIRYSIKKFAEALKASDADNVKSSLVNAIKVIDKAAAKGVIHQPRQPKHIQQQCIILTRAEFRHYPPDVAGKVGILLQNTPTQVDRIRAHDNQVPNLLFQFEMLFPNSYS